jgi:glycosyltransferase involved in cell wall biosynthesis
MPAHNSERWIGAAIDSVLAQTFDDFELLIVDDGSTDGTPAIVAQYEERDRRIRVLRPGRVGAIAARNLAIHEARGEYIANMDSDDLSMPERLAKEVAVLDANPDVLAVTAGMAVIHHQLAVPADLSGLKLRTPPAGPAGRLNGFGLKYRPVYHGPTMFRRDALLRIGLYRRFFTHAEDADLFLRLEEVGTIFRLSNTLYLQRKHLENTSFRFPYAQVESTVLALLSAKRRRQGGSDLEGIDGRPFWRLFHFGLTPTEIIHTLILSGLRCGRKALKRSKSRRRRSTAMLPCDLSTSTS